MAKMERQEQNQERKAKKKADDQRVPGTYKMGNYTQKVDRNDKEMVQDWKKNESIPGASKNRASFESTTKRNAMTRDIAMDDTRVLDEEYDYTKVSWPGKMQPDENLERAEKMQIRHRPQNNADTTK